MGNYPLVNIEKAMENHHFEWDNQLRKWPFSIAFWCFLYVYQRVMGMPWTFQRLWDE